MPEYVLKIREVTKSFGGLLAVAGVSMDVEKNTLTILIGPNGSGKTTLINLITGVYRPDRGRIFFDGLDITDFPSHEIFRLGISRTFQIPQPFRKLTVLENMLTVYPGNPGEGFVSALKRNNWRKFEEEAVEKALELLKFLKLDHLWHQEAEKLSGGQMKLLEIGRALMAGAKLLIMDEPIAGVNPVIAHDIFKTLRKLKDEKNLTILTVEHRLDIALRYVDYVYVMAAGSMIASGKPEEVVSDKRVIDAYLGG
ncbi:MAG: ABC transporter ATP-binding protein [Nitrososphaerota archaeon]|nr:ABC transporter ATP-binding protein [Aigarchaeota archaeon]MDW8076994.1 ABC transporter ATP-binding protein [Nitrososphaerota archaeon]